MKACGQYQGVKCTSIPLSIDTSQCQQYFGSPLNEIVIRTCPTEASSLAQRCAESVRGKKVRRKVRKFVRLTAKLTSLDFTDPKSSKKKARFERKLLKVSKALSGTFKYTVAKRGRRRYLIGDTAVEATLAFESNSAAETRATALSTNQFASDLSAELQSDSDFADVAVTDTQGELKTYEVTELVDDPGVTVSETATSTTQHSSDEKEMIAKTAKPVDSKVGQNRDKIVKTTTTTFVLGTGTRAGDCVSMMVMMVSAFVAFANLL